MLKKFRFSLLKKTFRNALPSTLQYNYYFRLNKTPVSFCSSNKNSDKNPQNTNDNNPNISNDNNNANIPPNSNDKKNKPPPKLEEDFQAKLETFSLETKKFELTPKEEALPQKTYAFFSSQQSALAKNNTMVSFNIGNLSESNLDHEIAFFMQVGDASKDKIYRVGLVLDTSVNRTLKKEIKKNKKLSSRPSVGNLDEISSKSNNYTITLKLKEKNYRVKLAEIQIGPDGILAKCIPYKDLDQDLNNNPSTPIAIEFEPKNKENQPFPLNNEINRIFTLINVIKIYLGYDKIQSFENTYSMLENKENLTNEKVDKLMLTILGELEKISKYIKEDFTLISQAFIESRSLILRVLFIRKKLEKIWESLELVNRNFKIVDENMKKMEMINKARMCLELINYSNNSTANNKEEATMNDRANIPLWKKFMNQLDKIENSVSKEKVRKEIERFQLIDRNSGEYHKIYTYLDEVFSIPWNKFSEPYWNVKYTSKILEDNIYGLEKVKERILEMVAVNKLKSSDRKAKGFIILLHGPPGTGKTSIAKNIAQSLKRTSRLISFSGVSDSHFIKGHRRTYVDSQPGVFIKEIIKSGVMNPVFILDEIDKITEAKHGDNPYNSLLEILNPEENSNFVDHYLDIKVDFSHVIFILTANEILNILGPLKNRLEIISIAGYIEEEKLSIAQNYIMPQVLQDSGITEGLSFNNKVLSHIIKGWCCYESGVRELKRSLERITRKYVTEIMKKISEESKEESENDSFLFEMKEELKIKAKQEKDKEKSEKIKKNDDSLPPEADNLILSNTPQNIPSFIDKSQLNQIPPLEDRFEIKQNPQILRPLQTAFKSMAPILNFDDKTDGEIYEFLRKYLGPPDQDYHLEERSTKSFPPGVLNILAASNHIGEVLKVECVYDLSKPDKKGEFTTSGNLKNVVQESIQVAKINAFRYLSEEQIKEASEKNIHVHFMSGAMPKDGPSAGIAFCTAFLSLVLKKPVPANWSMTGELTLKGEISRIGGVNGKLIASKSLRINKIIMPLGNLEEVMDLPKKLLQGLSIYFVKEFKEVYALIFEGNENIPCVKDGVLKNERVEEVLMA